MVVPCRLFCHCNVVGSMRQLCNSKLPPLRTKATQCWVFTQCPICNRIWRYPRELGRATQIFWVSKIPGLEKDKMPRIFGYFKIPIFIAYLRYPQISRSWRYPCLAYFKIPNFCYFIYHKTLIFRLSFHAIDLYFLLIWQSLLHPHIFCKFNSYIVHILADETCFK